MPKRPARKPLEPSTEWPIGLTVTAIRPLSPIEMVANGWVVLPEHQPPLGLVLSDGTILSPSEDPTAIRRGRTASDYRYGSLVGLDPDGQRFRLSVPREPQPATSPEIEPKRDLTRILTSTLRGRLRQGARFTSVYTPKPSATPEPAHRRVVLFQTQETMTSRDVGRYNGIRYTLTWKHIISAWENPGGVYLYDRLGGCLAITSVVSAKRASRPKRPVSLAP